MKFLGPAHESPGQSKHPTNVILPAFEVNTQCLEKLRRISSWYMYFICLSPNLIYRQAFADPGLHVIFRPRDSFALKLTLMHQQSSKAYILNFFLQTLKTLFADLGSCKFISWMYFLKYLLWRYREKCNPIFAVVYAPHLQGLEIIIITFVICLW